MVDETIESPSGDDFEAVKQIINQYFTVLEFHEDKHANYFVVGDYNPEDFSKLILELDNMDLSPFIYPDGELYQIRLASKSKPKNSKIHVNLILFLATIGTTLFAGYLLGNDILVAISFAVALLAIIGTHETAHFYAARKHGVKATLPYFIPAPTLIGTFGAVINVKSPIPNRNALFDLGISGPVAGLIVTIPVLIIGLSISTVTVQTANALIFNPPLIMDIIAYFAAPTTGAGQMIYMHPVAFAGWVGVVITMLNLMPVAFLDGGHITRSLFSKKIHFIISLMGVTITILLGWIPMAILMALILVMGREHPGALDNVIPITRRRKLAAVAILAVLILCLAPAPI